MRLQGIKVGWGITGSHCTLDRVYAAVKTLREQEGADLIPIFSPSMGRSVNRFGDPVKWKNLAVGLSGQNVIESIEDAEPIGPKKLLDIMLIAPCSGNTLAKLANGIVDSPVLMAAKAHLRNDRPVVISISTNDGLGLNARNLGILLNAKNIYWVPFGQDDPEGKQNSLVARVDKLGDTVCGALNKTQIQPVLIEY